MSPKRLLLLILFICASYYSRAQADSTIESLQQIPVRYIKDIDKKIGKYSSRISNKTERTLVKLSRWENTIKSLLEKTNPEAARRLFGNNQTTFSSLLEKLREGKSIAENYKIKFNDYSDKLRTCVAYLEQQKDNLDSKIINPVKTANKKLKDLEEHEKNSEFLEAFIKERKKQLINESIKYIGNSKYLAKINKEAYYYVETLRNYKEIFHDKDKAEKTALGVLNKIPAFQQFMKENSMMASLFRLPSGYGANQSVAGLQTRASVNALIQNQISVGGPNAQAQLHQNFQSAQAQLNDLKAKILKAGGGNSDTDIPDFTPNKQKTKTLKQRMEYGSDFQFGKNNRLLPTTADIGLSLGYKLNDKSVIGLGASYKMGFGSLQRLSISHQGLGLRSFVDWKLKKQFFVSGGYEMNYNAAFKNIEQLQKYNDWQPAGLIGLAKKIKVKTKMVRGTKMQILYDVLAKKHIPASQPVIFRIGYNF